MSGLFISASGILDALRRNDIAANNIANLQTPGFQASRADSVSTPGGGVELGGVTRDLSRGPILVTGRPLDAAADGFFRVRLADGTIAFTRDGHFGLNAEGRVVTSGGALAEPPIQAPPNSTNVVVTADGSLFATVPGQDSPQLLGRLEVFQFPNERGLQALGGNLFRATEASGEAQVVASGAQVIPGAVEGSNVDLATEQINLLLNRQAFQANVNAFRAQDEVLGELLNLLE